VIASLASEAGRADDRRRHQAVPLRGQEARGAGGGRLEALRDCVDTIITIPNERLLTIIDRRTTLTDAFSLADDVLRQAIQGISDLILMPGLINLDFADVKTIMSGMGVAMMGTGTAEGEGRAMQAAQKAIASPLLEDSTVNGARGVIINVTGGPGSVAARSERGVVRDQEAAHEEANIIFGAVVDPTLTGQGEDHRHRDRVRSQGRWLERAFSGGADAGRHVGIHGALRAWRGTRPGDGSGGTARRSASRGSPRRAHQDVAARAGAAQSARAARLVDPAGDVRQRRRRDGRSRGRPGSGLLIAARRSGVPQAAELMRCGAGLYGPPRGP
jgi:hypothetical protein